MSRLLKVFAIGVLAVTTLAGCGVPSAATPAADGLQAFPLAFFNGMTLSLAKLPASGSIVLAPVDTAALDSIGLGGPTPLGEEPPSLPFDEYGMYWSERFSVGEGDTLQVKVSSATPVSWFGVDWSNLDIRGVVTTCDVDEDGRTYDPKYPVNSSVASDPTGSTLTLNYAVPNDTEMVIVVRNANPSQSYRLSMQVTRQSHFTFKRFLEKIPIVKDLIKPGDS